MKSQGYLKLSIYAFFIIAGFLFFSPTHAEAANRYWVGGTNGANTNSTANWSATINSACGANTGASVPTSADAVVFESTCTNGATIDANFSVSSITINTSYTGTITQASGITITTAGVWAQSAGTFTGGNSTITIGTTFTLTNGTFTATSGTINAGSSWTYTAGTFNANGGTVNFTDTTHTIAGTHTLNNVTFNASTLRTYTISNTITVTGTLTFASTGTGAFTTNTGTINAQGNINMATSATGIGGGNATININGTVDQTLTGSGITGLGLLPSVTINKASGTLFLVSTINVFTNWTYTTGTLDAGTSIVHFADANHTITGSHTLYNVDFNSNITSKTFTIASGTVLTIAGTFTTMGTTAISITTGDIYVKGNMNINNTATNASGTGTITINGTVDQTITSSVASNQGRLPNVTINKPSGALNLAGIITVTGTNWTWTAGTINPGTSTIYFTDTAHTITGSHTLANVEFTASAVGRTLTIAVGTILTTTGTLTLSGTNNLTLTTGDIYAKGDITSTNTGSSTGGTTTITINGTVDQTITGSGTRTQGALPNVVINKASGTLNLVSIISVAGTNWTYTAGTINSGSSTLYFYANHTFTGSHTLGNVEFNGGSPGKTETITAGTVLTISGTLTTSGTNNLIINTGDIYAKGDVMLTNSGTNGGGSGIITINGTVDQTITGSGTRATGNLPNVVINKASGTLNLVSIISVAGTNWTWTAGTINPGTSTIYFTDTAHTITGSHTLANVEFTSSAIGRILTVAAATVLTTTGTLTLSGTNSLTINTGDISAQGDVTITNTNTGGGGTATITFNGTGTQTLTGQGTINQGKLPNIVINKVSGTLNLASIISIAVNWTWTAGTVDPGTSTLYLAFANHTITGSHSLYNVTITGGGGALTTIASGTILTTLGTLSIPGGASNSQVVINTGDIYAKGNINITNLSTGGGGTSTITINGTGDQTLTGSGTVATGVLPNIVINKVSGTLTLASTISIGANWTYTAGAVDAGTSTIYVPYANHTFTGSHSLYNVTFTGGGGVTTTIAAGTVLTTLGTLSVAGTGLNTQVIINTGDIHAEGPVSIINDATGAGGTATLTLSGSNAQTFSKTTSGPFALTLIINKTNQTDTVTLGADLTWALDLTVTRGTLKTGGFNITGASTKTFTVSNGASFEMSGNSNYPVTFTNFTYGVSSTIKYLQNQAKTITNATYGNLTLAPSAAVTFTLPATVTAIPGNLVIGDGSTAGIITAATNNPSFTVRGNLTINANATFTKGSGTLTLASGTGSQSWTDSTSGQDLGAVTVASNSTNTTVTVSGSPKATTLTINSSQAVDGGSAILILTGTGTPLTATGFTASTGTVSYTGATANLNAATYNNLTLGAGTYTAPAGTLTINGNFTNGGTFTHNSGTVVVGGTGTSVLSGATTFNNFSATASGKTVNFTAGQTFRFNGLLTLTNITLGSTSTSQWFVNSQGTSSVNSITFSYSGCDVSSNSITVNTSINNGHNGTCWSVITVPDAPTIGTATGGNAQASVTFTPPVSDGGSTITGYTVTSSPGGFTGTGGSSPIIVSGLTNGTPYTFTVTATNAIGTSSPSAASNSVTPATVPGAPIIGIASMGNGEASVTFSAPVSNGGATITGYTATSNPGGFTGTGASSPITVTGLSNGTSYTFTVTATNSVGTGAASAASNAATPATVPDAPTIGSATGGNAQASVTFSAPGFNGGSTITIYTATSSPGGFTGSGASSPVTVTGLANGTAYTFTVTATNVVGTGSASAASNSTTPATVPSAPQSLSATGGNAQISLTWSAPASAGGAAITGYKIYRDTSTNPTTLIDTLGVVLLYDDSTVLNGTEYFYRVTAINSAGESTYSNEDSATPVTTPSVPQNLTTTNLDTRVDLAWDAPTEDGGSVVTGYEIYRDESSPATTLIDTVGVTLGYTDLVVVNGTQYFYRVKAINAVGTSDFSNEDDAMPNPDPITILDEGTNPADEDLDPSGSITDLDGFTFSTNVFTDSVTALTVTLGSGNYASISEVRVTSEDGATTYFTPVSDPSGDEVEFSGGTPIPVTSTPVEYKIRITSKSHIDMPVPPGGTYEVTGTVTAFTSTNPQAGTDTTSATLTIDNESPENPVWDSIVASHDEVPLSWTNPAVSDFAQVIILKSTSTITDAPTEGEEYVDNDTIGISEVIYAGDDEEYTDTDVVNETTYYYKIFARDDLGNYSTGTQTIATPTTNPVTSLMSGIDPANTTVAPGTANEFIDEFNFETNINTDIITSLTVTTSNTAVIDSIKIMNNAMDTMYYTLGTVPDGNEWELTGGTPITATTSEGVYHILISFKDHAGILGGLYGVTANVSSWVGTNAASGSDSADTTITVDRQAPANVTSGVATMGDGEVFLSWTNAVDADFDSVVVLRDTSTLTDSPEAGTSYITGNTVGSATVACVTSSTSCTDAGVLDDTDYSYKIFSLDIYGNYSTGDEPVWINRPDAPINFAGTPHDSSVSLSWSPPIWNGGATITDYVVEYKLTSGGVWSTFADGVSTSTVATVTSLSNGNSYDFRVSAVNEKGTGEASDPISVTPEEDGEPAQVLIMSFTDLTIPSIKTAVRITNEGVSTFEYQYTWCVTDSSGNDCGGGDDVFGATAAKLIAPSENFDTVLNSTVPVIGSYFFHVEVTFGSDSSEAIQSFTATKAASSGGGGGGGGALPGAAVYIAPPTTTSIITWCNLGERFSAVTGLPCTAFLTPSTAITTSTTPPVGATFKKLKFGMTNDNDVYALQLFLISQNIGPAGVALKTHGATHYFGLLTVDALVEWQKYKGLTSDGVVGPLTSTAINNAKLGLTVPASPIVQPTIPVINKIPLITKDLSMGTNNDDQVYALQLFLISQNIGPAAAKLKAHGATHNFAPLTYDALVEWQKAKGLTADGVVGPATMTLINSL